LTGRIVAPRKKKFLYICPNERDWQAKKMAPPHLKAFENVKEEFNVFENLTCSVRNPKDLLIHLDTCTSKA